MRGWSTNIHPFVYLGRNGHSSHTVVAPFFWDFVDRKFVLRAKGAPEIAAHATRGYWASGWFYLRIEPGEYRRMQPGVPYALVPANKSSAYRWSASAVTLVR